VLDGFFARYSGTTLRTYRYKLLAFSRWLGVPLERLPVELLERGAARVTVEVERYRAHLRDDRRMAPSTINGHLAAIRSVVTFLRRAQLCGWTLEISSERAVSYRDTRGPGIPSIRLLLRVAARQADPRKAARDLAILRLLTDRALRRGELVGLDLEHVELEGGDGASVTGPIPEIPGMPVAVLIRGKGKGERERLSLPPKTRVALAGWLAARGDEPGPLFIALDPGAGRVGRGQRPRPLLQRLTGEGVARILASLAERAELSATVRPHGIRHSAITALLDAGVGLREAQRFSRHADPRTLMRYDDNRADLAGDMARRVSELV
jgi:integrase/recombinase XerC